MERARDARAPSRRACFPDQPVAGKGVGQLDRRSVGPETRRGGKITTRNMTKMRVKVWDKSCEITVYQKSKTVWIAVGDYMGQSIEVKGRSSSSAASLWRETARYRGN